MISDNNENEKAPIYKHKPRNENTLWRYREDGKYISRPIDPDYQKKYYATHNKSPITCDLCGSLINRTQKNRHQESKKCKSIHIFVKEQLEKHK